MESYLTEVLVNPLENNALATTVILFGYYFTTFSQLTAVIEEHRHSPKNRLYELFFVSPVLMLTALFTDLLFDGDIKTQPHLFSII